MEKQQRSDRSKAPLATGEESAPTPTALAVIGPGVSTSRQFANVMAAIIHDVIAGAITPGVANAAVNAGGKLLKVKELELRSGIPEGKTMQLAGEGVQDV